MAAANDNASARPVTGRMVLACLIAFFAVVVGVNGIMIGAAVSTFGGVETASSYQAGLAYTRESNAAQAQDALRWQVKASVHPSAGTTRVEVDARDAEGRSLPGLQAAARLERPTDRRADQAVALHEDGSGHFRGTAAPLSGQWDLVIELSRGGERVFRSRNRVVLN
jgi:nitrogen fixation protein FixH